MPSLRDLLQVLYSGLENELLGSSVTNDPPSPPLSDIASLDSDEDEEEEIELENQKCFFHWELKVSSRSTELIPGDPIVVSAVEHEVLAELQHYEKVLQAQQQSFPVCPIKTSDVLDFSTVRGYAQYVKENGKPPDTFRRALLPITLAECQARVEAIFRVNRAFEQSRQQENAAAANEDLRRRFNTSPGQINPEQHDKLYSLLAERPKCGKANHSAIIPCSGSDGSNSHIDLILSVCDEESQPCDWHQTRLIYERSKTRGKRPSPFDICKDVRHFFGWGCLLPLSFDGSQVWRRGVSQEMKETPLQKPSRLTLDELFQKHDLRKETTEIRMKKSRLALQLALVLQRLYPGPWIQQNWSTKSIQLLSNMDSTENSIADLDQVGISSALPHEWQANNIVWREFVDAEDFTDKLYCKFFLSFAQLLLDISNGSSTTQSPPDDKTWYAQLSAKAKQIQADPLLKWYGVAIQDCARFVMHYSTCFDNHSNQRKRAQTAIRTSIVESLQKNMLIWEAQWESHLQASATELMDRNATRTNDSSSYHEDPASPRRSYLYPVSKTPFGLFQAVYEVSNHGTPDDATENEFILLMRKFTDKYLPRSLATRGRPIRIAVLDTGLLIDESDTLLLAGARRVLSKLSRSYVGTQGVHGKLLGYEDTDGHGTHVIRLLLHLTRHTEIVAIKISDGPTLEHSSVQQVVDALNYAGSSEGADADIINLSFGLDETAKDIISPVIQSHVERGKLIFAAASNSGGNGKRAYPAKEDGVFAIHATNFEGTSPEGLNPPCNSSGFADNFATLGCQVPSRWKGKDMYITGTSFATPVAAAIAANVLDFVERAPLKCQWANPRYFFIYRGMRNVFAHLSSQVGNYDYVRPWNEGMFEDEHEIEEMHKKLQRMSAIDIQKS